MNRKYTIYVGTSASTERVARTVGDFTKSATIYEATGLWLGDLECTVVVEIFGTESDKPWTRTLARELRQQFNQDAVLWTVQEVETYLFERD